MSYRSLYRRMRPLKFSEMIGQEHITRTLSNALAHGRLGHAYLFCGPRGTGKTTAAKIMARAVNCERYPAPEPCGECSSCRHIATGASMDVLEMDAASNRGIDEIRELRERTRYATGEGRYKVYIIDEAHMLTFEAFNAFLKTLEEPPPGVIFILATTEPSKIPPTIISRCQRFDFHLLTAKQIFHLLRRVAKQEGCRADDEALQLIARLAEGSLRDALGLLEQCMTYGEGKIEAENVRDITGATRVEVISRLVEAIAAGDLAGGLSALEEVLYGGRDLALFMRDLIYLFSRLLLVEQGASGMEIMYGFREPVEHFQGRFPRAFLLEGIEVLHQAAGELRYAHIPQYILEITLIRLLRLLNDQSRLAGDVTGEPIASPAAGSSPKKKAAQKHPAQTRRGSLPETPPEVLPEVLPEALPETSPENLPEEAGEPGPATAAMRQAGDKLANLQQNWPRLIREIGKKRRSTGEYLSSSFPCRWEGNRLVLSFKAADEFYLHKLMQEDHRTLVEKQLAELVGGPLKIEAVVDSTPGEATPGDTPAGAPPLPESEPEPEMEEYLLEEALRLFKGHIFDADTKEE